MPGIDQRMSWIRLQDKYEAHMNAPIPGEEIFSVECEIASEKEIPSVLEYGNIYLRPLFDKSPYSDSLHTYYLRIDVPLSFNSTDASTWEKASAKGYYSKGYIREILDILALISRSRLYLISITQTDIEKRPTSRYSPPFAYAESPLHANPWIYRNINGFGWDQSIGYLDKLKTGVAPEQHLAISLAVQLYHSSLKLIGSDHELAYLSLVSTIECLLSNFELEQKDDIDDIRGVEEMVNSSTHTRDTKNELKQIFSHRKIKRKFIRFLEAYSKGYFIGGNYSTRKQVKITREEAFNLSTGKIAAIYDARSKFVHEGRNMYISTPIDLAIEANWDIDPSLGMVIDRRRFTAREKLPYLHFFEGLVRKSLLNYIDGVRLV